VSNALRIPAFVNPESGTAEEARNALSVAGLFDIREVHPRDLADAITSSVRSGSTRIVVAGGDGTVRTAAGAVAGTAIELGIIPGGTLNHFARDQGIPSDLEEAARIAGGDTITEADAGYVGDEIFVNTSSIGAYVSFKRVRERLEPRLGYRLASLIASIRTFFYLRNLYLELDIDGKKQIYRTPMVFIGVGERELAMPTLGNRAKVGKRGLHVMIVRGRFKARLLALAWEAMRKGTESAARTPELDSFIVDSCTIRVRRPTVTVALDGETMLLDSPLEYRLERDILRIVRGT
jgi:diacylglycerol kinase family enzyme